MNRLAPLHVVICLGIRAFVEDTSKDEGNQSYSWNLLSISPEKPCSGGKAHQANHQ